jgi:hypothetical protein
MKIARISQIIKEEVNLDIKTLDKLTKDGKKRGQVLVDILKKGNKITVTDPEHLISIINGDEIANNITRYKKYDSDKSKKFFTTGRNYNTVIKGSDDEEYKLNQIKKTSEFGSSAGSSAGSAKTKIIESLHCVLLAYRQYNEINILRRSSQEINYDDLRLLDEKEVNINEFKENFQIPFSIAEISKYPFSQFESYEESFVDITNVLYNDDIIYDGEDSAGDILLKNEATYIFSHASYIGQNSIPKLIADKYNQLERMENFQMKINYAKFTPADIWVIRAEQIENIYVYINDSQTLEELSSKITELFDNGSLYGISLKKIGAGFKVVINMEDSRPQFDLDNSGIVPTQRLNAVSVSIKCKITNYPLDDEEGEFESKELVLRNFGGKELTADVSGDNSRQGKISLSAINFHLSENDQETIPTFTEIDSEWDDDEIIMQCNILGNIIIGSDGFIYTNSDILSKNLKGDPIEYEKGKSNLISKFQALYFSKTLKEMNQDMRNSVMNSIFYHAMSIETDAFISPKYVRFI